MTVRGARRLLDANLNRAREGSARFGRHGAIRLERAGPFCPFAVGAAPVGSDHPAGVPSAGGQPRQRRRSGPAHEGNPPAKPAGLVAANFRRVEEALRVLEEYGKVLSPRAAGGFKRIRFDMYTLEKEV
jgi:thiamine-phosphate pyrophosphorylase